PLQGQAATASVENRQSLGGFRSTTPEGDKMTITNSRRRLLALCDRRAPQRRNLSRFAYEECGHTVVRLGCFFGCEGEIAEVGSLCRGAFCPEDEKLASILRGVRAMCLAGLEMQ